MLRPVLKASTSHARRTNGLGLGGASLTTVHNLLGHFLSTTTLRRSRVSRLCGVGRQQQHGWREHSSHERVASPVLPWRVAAAAVPAVTMKSIEARNETPRERPALVLPQPKPLPVIASAVPQLQRRRRMTPLQALLKAAWRHLRREGGWLLLSAALGVAAAALGVATPLALGAFWDVLSSSAGAYDLVGPAARLGGLQLGRVVLQLLSSSLLVASSERAASSLRADLFHVLVAEAPLALFDATDGPALGAVLSDDVKELRDVLRGTLAEGLPAAARVALSASALWALSPKLTLALAAALPALVAAGTAYAAGLRRLARLSSAAQAEAASAASESLSSVRVVRAFTGEAVETRRYEALLRSASQASIAVGTSVALFQIAATAALAGVAGGVAAGGALLVSGGSLTKGGLAAFLGQTFTLQGGLEAMAALGGRMARVTGGPGTRVGQLLLDAQPHAHHVGAQGESGQQQQQQEEGEEDAVPPREGTVVFPHLIGDVEFRDVTFSYPNRPDDAALRGLSLTLRAGTVTALVGPSGSGKSSVVSLMLGLYPLQQDAAAPSNGNSGSITVDGVPLRHLHPGWYRRHTALVPQEPTLWNAPLRENLAYGRAGLEERSPDCHPSDPRPGRVDGPSIPSSLFSALVRTWSPSYSPISGAFGAAAARRDLGAAAPDDTELLAAARAAHAGDFIASLPGGLDTVAGDRGSQLSGGQRQRIAIARALLRRPRILLLDEATSALDAEAEAALGEVLAGGFASSAAVVPPTGEGTPAGTRHGPTVLLIAHRLSTCRHADRIVVMDRGRVVEEGTHHELLRREGGLYARLVARQQGPAAGHPPPHDASSASERVPSRSLEQLLDELLEEDRRQRPPPPPR